MSFSRRVFWVFAIICFASAVLVAFGDIGNKESIPNFRIKAVVAATICGLYFLHSARNKKL